MFYFQRRGCGTSYWGKSFYPLHTSYLYWFIRLEYLFPAPGFFVSITGK